MPASFFCLESMLLSASSDHIKVVRDGRVEHFSLMQGKDIDGEVVEERVGDEEVDRIAFLLGCDQLFISHWAANSRLVPVVGEERRGRTERM
jgi:hypothetical protein